MDDWLIRARNEIASAANIPPDELELDSDAEVTLLDLARIAAHESGERTNAPLLCYLIGRPSAEWRSMRWLTRSEAAARHGNDGRLRTDHA